MAASIEAHNQKPAATWSSGGGAYDEVSHQISSALEHCVVRLDPKADEKVLDLATGTGWTSRLEARRGAKVTGADIAEDLLADARARAAAENLAIEYKIGDAEKLPFGDGEFDAISSTFGVMFVSRPEAAAAEIARVCRSGGRLAMTTWLPGSSVFKMFQVMRPYMAPPPNPAPPSPFAWGRQDRIRELFGSNFDVRFETGVTNYYDRSGQGRLEQVRHRLWPDQGAGGKPRRGAAQGPAARFRQLPRRLQDRARFLPAARVLAHVRATKIAPCSSGSSAWTAWAATSFAA